MPMRMEPSFLLSYALVLLNPLQPKLPLPVPFMPSPQHAQSPSQIESQLALDAKYSHEYFYKVITLYLLVIRYQP